MFERSIDKHSEPTRIFTFLLLVIIILGSFVRFSYYNSLCSDPLPTIVSATNIMDQNRFIELAKEFSSGQWLGSTVTRYSPAYSYFIAVIFTLFGQDMYYVFVIQFLIGALTPLLYYKTASLLFNNRKVGLISALIGALYSPMIFFEGTLLRASLIAFFNLVSFYFLLSAMKKEQALYCLYGGIAIGLSAVLRPNILPFILIPYIFALTKGRLKKFQFAALLLAGIVIVVAPLSIRNKILKKDVLISYQGPSTFWIGNTYDSSGIGLWRSPLRGQFANEANGSTIKTLEILFREIKHHPLEYLDLYGRKFKMYFNAYEIPANLSYDQFAENHTPLRWAVFNFSIICPFALLGLFLCWRKYPFMSLCYLYFVVLGLSNILFHIQGRYRIPAIPFFILFASLGIYWLIYTLKQRKYKTAIISCFLIITLSFMTSPNSAVIQKYFGNYIRHEDFSNRHLAYYLLNKYEGSRWPKHQKQVVLSRGLAELDKELGLYSKNDSPNLAYILTLQSILLTEMKKYGQAKQALDRALKLSPANRQYLLRLTKTKKFYKEYTFKDLSFKQLISKKAFQKIFQ